ncbi:MAG TPA: hypothetical protein DCG75_08695 [Bacteroidales bacterium]|nr:hypothetical protein [Bacteroidales bacterium]
MEIWKVINGFEDYEISNIGNVKSLSRKMFNGKAFFKSKEKIINGTVNYNGYLVVSLFKDKIPKKRQIHQLVAIAFHNHTPCGFELVVNHKDFNKLNNNAENLEIVTNRENCNLKHIKSSSEYVGVGFHKLTNKWQSRIYINGKREHLGYFKTELEAHNVYQNKLKSL